MDGNSGSDTAAPRSLFGLSRGRWRLTIGLKLGLAFAALLTIVYVNTRIAIGLFDKLGSSTQIVNETGRLRYLSQKIAYLATRQEPGDRPLLGAQLYRYNSALGNILTRLEGEGRSLLQHNPGLGDRLARLGDQWRRYAAAARSIIDSEPGSRRAQNALQELQAQTETMLTGADDLVDLLAETDRQLRQQVELQLQGMLLFETLFLALVFLMTQRGVSQPLRRLAGLCRSFASGEHSVRMSFASRDEVGDLASSFNRTAEITSTLIRDLNERNRESRVLHRVADLLQQGPSREAAVAGIAQLLPQGWCRREITAAQVRCGTTFGQSANYRPTPWQQQVQLASAAGQPIELTVCYQEDQPLPGEERRLLEDVARMLVTFIDKDDAQHEQARLLAILENTSDLVATVEPTGRIVYLNQAGRRILGLAADLPAGRITDHYAPWAAVQYQRVFVPEAIARGGWVGEVAMIARDGEEIPMSQALTVHRGKQGEVEHFSITARDISQRIRLEERLIRSRDFYLGLFNEFPALIWRSDATGNADFFNRTFVEFTGRPLDRLLAGGTAECVHPEDRGKLAAVERAAIEDRVRFEIEFRLRHADGNYRWMLGYGRPYRDMDGDFAGLIGVIHDISERKRLDRELEKLANFDSLTGLPNRNLISDRIGQAIAFARRQDCQAAVMFLDLDRFKTINETLGHEAGDRLLAAVAQRLRGCLREGDTVARIGGDDFVVVVTGGGPAEGGGEISSVADKLLEALAVPFWVEGQELFVSGSLGISVYPRDGDDAGTLLKHADAAMYRAKDEGRNNWQYYANDMNAQAHQRLSLESSLRRALERQEFVLHYQPQVDTATGRIVGLEALVRWQHPTLGMVPPGQFIPVAEETGLIVPLGDWVLHTACAQNRAWQRAGLPPVRVAVNISARQFRQRSVVRLVKDTLTASGLDGSGLDLELTESMLMHDPEQIIVTLGQLKQLGLRIALDDFGTGYSSLAYLQRFPIDEIKVDRSFVLEIESASGKAPLVLAILGIARSLGLGVVAEGVETTAQQDFLKRHGCDRMQGYLLGRPLGAAEVAELLAAEALRAPS